MVDRTGKPVGESTRTTEERNSSSVQIRTLFDEQRQIDYRRMLRESFSSRTPSSSSRNKNAKFYKKNYGVSKRIFVKFINKILLRWRNYENSRVLPSIRTRSSSRTRTLLWNYLDDYQELQNEVNCMNDSKDFQDAESVRSGNSHVTSQPMLFPKYPIPEGLLRAFIRIAAPAKKGCQIFGIHLAHWETFFANPQASSTAPYPQELNPWRKNHWRTDSKVYSGEEWKTRTKSRSAMPVWTVSQRFSHLQWRGDSSKNYGADQQQLQISDLHFDKFPTPAPFACWKMRFKTEVCTCSQFPTEAMQWIKEVELVDSVDE